MLHAARLIFEIIGTIAFAISGAMLAIHKHMDALGVTILGLTTATGGGIVRDLLIGTTPPSAFTDPRYAIIAIVTSIVVFIPYVRRAFDLHEKGLPDDEARLMAAWDKILSDPDHHVIVYEQNGQIAITLYPLRVHVANYGLRCGTDDKGLRQSGTSCQMAVLTLLQGGVGYHSTFHGKAFHMLGLFLQEANRN